MSRISGWRCDCGAYNSKADEECEACGRRPGEARDDKPHLPAYREFPQRPRPASNKDERCPEPGCEKTVADHIREFRDAGRRIEARSLHL